MMSPIPRWSRRVILCGGLAALVARAAENPPTAAEPATADQGDALAKSIVERADQIRFPAEGFEVDVAVTNLNAGQVTETRRYRILSKGNENTIVQTTEPASERGQALLMRGRDLWVFLPSVSQPVRLSLSQRLTGQVANGDIARANFAGDYVPRIVRTEAVDGEMHHVLELVAAERGVTYARVLYWVRRSNNYPHKAEFYAVSEKLLKTCRYEAFQTLGGRVRPTRLVMRDALRAGEESVLEYSNMQLRDLPDRMFSKENMRRL